MLLAAALCALSLIARAEITRTAADCAALEARIEELTDRRARLIIEAEGEFQLQELEKYARDTLGMAYPRPEQVIYISVRESDSARILQREPEGKIQRLTGLIDRLMAYYTGAGA